METLKDAFNVTDLDSQLKRILDNFSSIFGIRIAYFLPDGSEYRIGSDKTISRYCLLLREVLGYESTCLALDAAKRNAAKESGKVQSYICHGGCNEAIKPIFSGGSLLGYIMIGQAVTRSGIPDTIGETAAKHGLAEQLKECYRELPSYGKKKMNDILELFSELTDLVVLKNLIHRKEQGPVKKVVEYMKTRDHCINLKQAAQLVNMSESRLRHRFLEEEGKTFSQVRTSICMEKAYKLLSSDRNIPVQEAAYKLGFSDPLYFSRVFRKHFGYPPASLPD